MRFAKKSLGQNFLKDKNIIKKIIGLIKIKNKEELNIKVNNDFLTWSKKVGNDLSTPRPEFGFPGLKDGDSWCICASWFSRAIDEGVACSVFLKKTNIKTLELIPLEKLKKFASDLS